MTAEIVIMNREAIAMAADSAVTMVGESDKKIFITANKLFSLSKFQPVGIMVFGNAVFMHIPWESIIKEYRNKLANKKFSTLKEYSDDFIKFFNGNDILFPQDVQENVVSGIILSYFYFIREGIRKEVVEITAQKQISSIKEIGSIIRKQIKDHYDRWKKAKPIQTIPDNFDSEIRTKYKQVIDDAIVKAFEKIPLTRVQKSQLESIACLYFCKFPDTIQISGTSGIVIAGFGEKDIYPSLYSFTFECVVNNQLKYESNARIEISWDERSILFPFAQREMVDLFMEGIDPNLEKRQMDYLNALFKNYSGLVIDKIENECPNINKIKLNKQLQRDSEIVLKDFTQNITDYKRENFTSPITRLVSNLPKSEMAVLAESLVNLTSIKRKFTMGSETVAGPIDVAIVSKGDGFIWIKRKHYFDEKLNPRYLINLGQGRKS